MAFKISKFNILLICIIIINLAQALLTPIIQDEAYYWKFSQHLDWGFFDHPPMVALLIFLNGKLFSGILGVRFLTTILMGVTMKLTWSLLPENNKKHKLSELLFFGLFLSIPICNIYGFITTADIALLTFGSLYLVVLKKLLEKKNVLYAALLGVIAALLLYSKYHGGIIILISIILNLKLLKNFHIYLAGIVALALLIPHILWQYEHDFVTFNYHFFERTDGSFKVKNIVEYILGALVILNPVLLFLLFWFLKIKKVQLSKELKFYLNIFIGFLLFFFINSFRSKIEAHWVAFAMIPLIIVLHSLITSVEFNLKKIKGVLIISVAIMLVVRVLITLDLPLQTEFHKEGKQFFTNVNEALGGQTVAYMNSYQKAAKHSFYTGKDAYSLNNAYYRKNQYDHWDYESKLHGEKVHVISNWPSKQYDSIKFSNGKAILVKAFKPFQMFSKINITLNSQLDNVIPEETYKLNLSIFNPYNYEIDLSNKALEYSVALEIKKGKYRKFMPIQIQTKKLPPNSIQNEIVNITFNKNLPKGNYRCNFVMKSGILPYQVVSEKSFKIDLINE